MVDVGTYTQEMKESLFSYQLNPESDEWILMLKREFKIIYQLESDQDHFDKTFGIFKPKIEKSMSDKETPLSLFENVALKAEIYEFLQAQKKIFKCYCCEMPAFENLDDLKAHIQTGKPKIKKQRKKNNKL